MRVTKEVSVIILNYNGIDYVVDCLRSVLDQDYPLEKYEVLFVDNNSSDDSCKLAEQFLPHIRVIQFPENYGFAEGNNKAVEFSSGKYIVFLNQDTIVHRNWLSELVAGIEKSERVGICHSNILMPWVDEYNPAIRDQYPDRAYYYELSMFGFALYRSIPFPSLPITTKTASGASMIIKRDLLGPLGGYFFDPALFTYAEDTDLALRVTGLGYQIKLIPTSVVYHNQKRKGLDKTLDITIKSIHIIKNRFTVFYKNMYLAEYIAYLPFLIIGSPLKVKEIGLKGLRIWIAGICLLPITLVAFFLSIINLHNFREKRKVILSKRRGHRFRLLYYLLSAIDYGSIEKAYKKR